MIHIRNAKCPDVGADSAYYKYQTWWHRECLLCGRWTEIERDGGAAWDANLSATYNDCYVEAGRPGQVRRAGGAAFDTPPSGAALTLIDPVNDANCIIANIVGYTIDTLYLDRASLAKPWVPATGLVGRVHVYGKTSLLPADSYTVLQSPVSSFQVRFRVSTTVNRPYFCGYPLGDYLTSKQNAFDVTWGFGTTTRRAVINADIDGDNFQVWSWARDSTSGYSSTGLLWAGGKLTDTRPDDDFPYFTTANVDVSTYGGVYPTWDAIASWPLFMLGRFGEPVTGYIEHYKYMSDVDYSAGGIWDIARWIQMNARSPIQYPWVVMGNVSAGGFKRGRLPWPIIHASTPPWLPINSERTLRSSYGRVVIPMAGLNGCDVNNEPRRGF